MSEAATSLPFDIAQHQRDRLRNLERENRFLKGERTRLEQLLALLLLMASRTIKQPPGLILDAVITAHGTDPSRAHIHQTSPLEATGPPPPDETPLPPVIQIPLGDQPPRSRAPQ